MKQVFQLETFEDIEKAFCGSRNAGDPVPMMEDKALLHIRGEQMSLESTRFVLGEHLRDQGKEFVKHCIDKAIGKRFTADALLRCQSR